MKQKTFIKKPLVIFPIFSLLVLFIALVFFPSCNKQKIAEATSGTPDASGKPGIMARLALNPGNIFVGSAYNMDSMARPNAEGWQTIRNYGVGLHVHPVSWRGHWKEFGNAIGPMLINKQFTYEFDIKDITLYHIDNMWEVNQVRNEAGLVCARVQFNVSAKDLNIDPNLPQFILDNVVKPFNNAGIAVDVLFSPISGEAFDVYNGKKHIEWLQENAKWIDLLFNQAHAQGVTIDFPPSYWADDPADHRYRNALVPLLEQAKANNKEVTLMVNFDNKGNNTIEALDSLYRYLERNDLLPARWEVNDFGEDNTFTPTPEKELDCRPTNHPAGAALYLCRQTSFPEPEELFYPDETKYYKIVGKQSNKCIDVSNISMQNNAPVWIWGYMDGLNQQWKFVPVGNGYYKIIARHSGMCLSVVSLSTNDGVNLVQQVDNNAPNQQWKIVNVCNGYYKIVSLYSGKCIDVQGYSTTDGGNIWQYEYQDGDNQKWQFSQTGDVP